MSWVNSLHKGGHCYILQNGLIIKSFIVPFNPLYFLELDHNTIIYLYIKLTIILLYIFLTSVQCQLL